MELQNYITVPSAKFNDKTVVEFSSRAWGKRYTMSLFARIVELELMGMKSPIEAARNKKRLDALCAEYVEWKIKFQNQKK